MCIATTLWPFHSPQMTFMWSMILQQKMMDRGLYWKYVNWKLGSTFMCMCNSGGNYVTRHGRRSRYINCGSCWTTIIVKYFGHRLYVWPWGTLLGLAVSCKTPAILSQCGYSCGWQRGQNTELEYIRTAGLSLSAIVLVGLYVHRFWDFERSCFVFHILQVRTILRTESTPSVIILCEWCREERMVDGYCVWTCQSSDKKEV